MKNIAYVLSVISILGFVVVPSHAGTENGGDLRAKLIRVFGSAFSKIKPGTTRAELAKVFKEDAVGSGISPSGSSAYQQNQTFVYRSCDLIKVDVSFDPSDSKQMKPTDVVSKRSLPYLVFAAEPSHADTNIDAVLTEELLDVHIEFQKVKPGMTRAELLKLFRENTGGVVWPSSKPFPFERHMTFDYRKCSMIEVDVDFAPSNSQEAQPTDIIIEISRPYIDGRPRV